MGGWLALAAVLLLGPRNGRYRDGRLVAFAPSSIPFLALGSWILIVGWFGFNVMSAQTLQGVSGLVAVNSLMAMVGGTVAALIVGRNDPGFLHNGPLAGLVAICAGSDLMHPVGALVTGAIAGALFVWCFTAAQVKWRIDDVLGVWPLHGLCGVWGGIACGIFGQTALGGLGGVSLISQLIGTALGVTVALARRLCGVWRDQGAARPAPEPGTGVLRRRPVDPQDRRSEPGLIRRFHPRWPRAPEIHGSTVFRGRPRMVASFSGGALMLPECQLFGTLGCHLCEVAEAMLMEFVERGLLVELVDIADDETWFAAYSLRIPVLRRVDTGAELGWPFSADEVVAFLR